MRQFLACEIDVPTTALLMQILLCFKSTCNMNTFLWHESERYQFNDQSEKGLILILHESVNLLMNSWPRRIFYLSKYDYDEEISYLPHLN